MAYINYISTEIPEYKYQQVDLVNFMSYIHPHIDLKKIKLVFSKSQIITRYSCLPDFYHNPKKQVLFKNGRTPNISERMAVFKTEASPLAEKAAKKVLIETQNTPTHLITVCCTGLYAPGLDYELLKTLSLPSNIERYGINFMGCFAAFHALKLANTICAAHTNAQVLIVAVELCTLHLHHGDSLESVVANALFADGAAACMVSNKESGLKIETCFQETIPNSSNDMAWEISENHFLMNLSSYIPNLIGVNLGAFFENIDMKTIAHHAVHPGGRKILEEYEKGLNLKKENLTSSYHILENFGNMSSPTILFVLKDIVDRHLYGKILATGFGPGLTMEGMVLSH